MKFLFIYAYKGMHLGKPETGEGSTEINLHGSDKITPKVIESACDIVRKDLNDKGIFIDLIAPMGWFKYDEEESEDNKDEVYIKSLIHNLSVRTYNALIRAGYKTLNELEGLTRKDASRIRHLGSVSLHELEQVMEAYGFKFKEEK